MIAILTQMLLVPTPRLRDHVASAPEPLDGLVSSMLARDREARPRDGGAVLSALDALAIGGWSPTASPPSRTHVALERERRPIGLVLARAPVSGADVTLGSDAATLARSVAEQIALRWGARADNFGADALALVVEHRSGPREQAARAARAALELAVALPDWSAAVSCTRADTTDELLADVVGRAALRLDAGAAGAIRLDAATAALLDVGFDVETTTDGAVLRGFSAARDDARPLLGRLTPCVGRDAELHLLQGALLACEEERSSRAVLVLADAGWGKSKLRREMVARVRDADTARVIHARAEMGGTLTSLALVRALLRDATGIGAAEGAPAWESFSERLQSSLNAADAIEILGELAGVPPTTPSEVLEMVRRDPAELRWRAVDAVAAWLRGASRERAVLLSVEDLHEADAVSVGLLTDAWKELGDAPLFLVGTARPEAEALHPALFELRGVQVVRLGPLSRRASERIARQALGDRAGDARIAQIVERGGGHPLLLEELVRHAASAPEDDHEPPATVLALLQSRLLALDPEARRLLRAASVFGERFVVDGVASLLPARERDAVPAILERLARDELVVAPRRGAADADRHAFRHALVCTAAYEMLPPEERTLAHRAAAGWLASQPRVDEASVADQLSRAGDAIAAAPRFLRACRIAANFGELEQMERLARRAQVEGIDPALRLELVLEEAAAKIVGGRLRAALARLREVEPWDAFEQGSGSWMVARALEAYLALATGELDAGRERVRMLLAVPALPPANVRWGWAMSLLLTHLMSAGLTEEARELLSRTEEAGPWPDEDPFSGFFEFAVSVLAIYSDSGRALGPLRRSLARVLRRGLQSRFRYGFLSAAAVFLAEHGCFAETLEIAHGSYAAVRQREEHQAHGYFLAAELAILVETAPAECVSLRGGALVAEEDILAAAIVGAHRALGIALAAREDRAQLDLATETLWRLHDRVRGYPLLSSLVRSHLARIELLRGEPERALALCEETLSDLRSSLPSARTALMLSSIRALDALGRREEARQRLGEAQARLKRIASEIEGDDERAAFLAHPLSAQTFSYDV